MQVRTAAFKFDDASMVEKTLEGDLDAYNQLVLAYQDIAFNVAYRILGERAGAEDVIQDAFLSAYLKLSTCRGGSFKTWLLRIVVDACHGEIRRREGRPVEDGYSINIQDEGVASPSILWGPKASREEAAVVSERSLVIQNCLNKLDFDLRTVVVLVDVMGMSYPETADVIGIPVERVNRRLSKARAIFFDRLKRL